MAAVSWINRATWLVVAAALACGGEPTTAPPTPVPPKPPPPVQFRQLVVLASSPTTYTGLVRSPVIEGPAVLVTDGHTRQAGVHLEFRVLSGGGFLGQERTVTGPTGTATSSFWILGAQVGEQQVGVFVRDTMRLVFTANAEPQPSNASPPFVYAAQDADERWHLFRLSTLDGVPQQLTSGPFNDEYPRPSPNGDRLAFTRNGRIQLGGIEAAGFAELPNHPSVNARSLSWSPDGLKLAFADALTSGLSVVGIDGSGHRNLSVPGPAPWDCSDCPCGTCPSFVDGTPAWSPDGSQIAFTRDEDLEFLVTWIMNADGTEARRLGRRRVTSQTTEWWAAWNPVWSPDGRIAFVGPDFQTQSGGPVSTVFGMDRDGTDVRVLARLSFPPLCAPTDWSASGQWMLLECTAGFHWQVHLLNLQTGTITVIRDARSAAFLPTGSVEDSR
jgi:Tol biopolymer transport system component